VMRPLIEMDSIAIEVTNACRNSCSNCTQLCGHSAPYYMSMRDVEMAIDSMVLFRGVTGIQGGEPLLHPRFPEICEYAGARIPPERLGLWTTLPAGFERYREIICETFGHIFLNDHTRDDVLHHPVLVAAEDLPMQEWAKWYLIDHCWVQNTWSAGVTPRGAFFCEVAAALDRYVPGPGGWTVEPGWWRRTPKDYVAQMEAYCWHCGCAMPLKKRESMDSRDDVSKSWLTRLEGSPKMEAGRYVDWDGTMIEDCRQVATYKDIAYRDRIAERYGMFLMINERGYQTPYLSKGWSP